MPAHLGYTVAQNLRERPVTAALALSDPNRDSGQTKARGVQAGFDGHFT